MVGTVVFQRGGHDYFIDFLKGVSILLVVITHTLTLEQEHILYFDIWGRVAVPIFLLIQVLHYFHRNPNLQGTGGGKPATESMEACSMSIFCCTDCYFYNTDGIFLLDA